MTRATQIPETQQTPWLPGQPRPPHDPDAPIVWVEQLSVRYESGAAIEDVNLELAPGERLAVIGPNGAGKSTLLKVIAGVLAPSEGKVHIYGNDPTGHICIAYVPQRSQVDWQFPATVSDVVMMGRIGQMGYFRNPGKRDRDIVRAALETVGLSQFSDRQIDQLSGGQQQRMFIARALAQEAELVLMDEPLTGLDVNSQEDIFSILDEMKTRRVTVVVALHDLKMAAQRFERAMLLKKRVLALGVPDVVFTPDHLMGAYGEHLHLVPTEDGALVIGDTCCDDEHDSHD
jgi:manganese/iron transport system ATP-binding protein